MLLQPALQVEQATSRHALAVQVSARPRSSPCLLYPFMQLEVRAPLPPLVDSTGGLWVLISTAPPAERLAPLSFFVQIAGKAPTPIKDVYGPFSGQEVSRFVTDGARSGLGYWLFHLPRFDRSLHALFYYTFIEYGEDRLSRQACSIEITRGVSSIWPSTYDGPHLLRVPEESELKNLQGKSSRS